MHAVIKVAVDALSSQKTVVSVTYMDAARYEVRSDNCLMIVTLGPKPQADPNAVPAPGPKQFQVHAEPPVCD